jgi:hypothetical protein
VHREKARPLIDSFSSKRSTALVVDAAQDHAVRIRLCSVDFL